MDDQLEDATCVLDAFHIVKLAGAAVDDVRRRIQQETLGHRGRKGDPLYLCALVPEDNERAARQQRGPSC
uniref:transposase n=1 Tax=Brachybacterium paraconglomeratum TaxID=173362 RepID=UPI00280A7859|nr:transposase [Brachybacterium paraconglomeratum]